MSSFRETVNLGSIKPGQLFKFKDEYYLRIVTHQYTCNCIKMGYFDICELAPGLLVETSKNWYLTPNVFAMLCYPGNAEEMADVWQKHLKELGKKQKETED